MRRPLPAKAMGRTGWALLPLLILGIGPQPPRAAAGQSGSGTEQPPLDESGGFLDNVLLEGGRGAQGRVEHLSGGTLVLATIDGQRQPLAQRDLVAVDFRIGQQGREIDRHEGAAGAPDVLVTYAGALVRAEVIAITEDSVVTAGATFPRGDIDRVVFGHEAPPRGPRVVDDGKTPPPDPETPTPPLPDPDPDSGGGAPSSRGSFEPGSVVEPCPEDEPLGAWVRLEYDSKSTVCRTAVERTLRFNLVSTWLYPSPASWPASLQLYGAPSLRYRVVLGECEDLPGDDMTCTAPPGRRSGRLAAQFKDRSGDASVRFDPLEPKLEIDYQLADAELSIEGRCIAPSSSGSALSRSRDDWIHIGPGRLASALLATPVPDPGDPQSARDYLERLNAAAAVSEPRISDNPTIHDGNFHVLVPPGPCADARPPQLNECSSRPDRFAVIPFAGRASASGNTSMFATPESGQNFNPKLEWRICCGCAGLPPEEAFVPEDETDCFAAAEAVRDWYEGQIASAMAPLPNLFLQFAHHYEATLRYVSDWRFVNLSCGLYESAITIAEHFVGEQHAYADAILKGRDFAEKISSGDFVGMVPIFGGLIKDIEKLVDAYRAYQGDDSKLQARLDSCAVVEEAFPHLYNGAQQFLRHRQQTERVTAEIHRRLQRLERLNIDHVLEAEEKYRDCVECATRHGKDPSRCPQPPELWGPRDLIESFH